MAMRSNHLKKGKVLAAELDSSEGFVTIIQEDSFFFGQYNKSPNGVYIAAFADGYIDRRRGKEEWVYGQIALIRNLREVLWCKRLRRPDKCAVSNNGIVAVINSPIKDKQVGSLHVYDENGKTLFEKVFKSYMSGCAITLDGRYVAAATAYPDNTIYFFDIETRELKWSYKNPRKEAIIDVSISDDKIHVWIGKSEVSKRIGYSLDFKGQLTGEYIESLEKLKTISTGPIEKSVEALIWLLQSNDNEQILAGLKEFKPTRCPAKYAEQLAPHVSRHLYSENEEIAKLSRDVMLRLGRLAPNAIEPYVEAIIKSAESEASRYGIFSSEPLFTLSRLGEMNPNWVRDRISMIIKSLKEHEFWNMRRFSAITIGKIGSRDPNLVKDAVPILTKYLGSSDWWLPQPIDEEMMADLACIEVCLRDAALYALGEIGGRDPELVKDFISSITSCLRRPEGCTRKSAIEALSKIAEKDSSYINPALSLIKEIAEKDPNEKAKRAAMKLLKKLNL